MAVTIGFAVWGRSCAEIWRRRLVDVGGRGNGDVDRQTYNRVQVGGTASGFDAGASYHF
jgi:hypothetical protein